MRSPTHLRSGTDPNPDAELGPGVARCPWSRCEGAAKGGDACRAKAKAGTATPVEERRIACSSRSVTLDLDAATRRKTANRPSAANPREGVRYGVDERPRPLRDGRGTPSQVSWPSEGSPGRREAGSPRNGPVSHWPMATHESGAMCRGLEP